MGWDYALVHLKYTIPPSVALTFLYRPLLSSIDIYKICFLITIAVISTIPWDSYLIRQRIWTYPANAVFGLTIWDIPAEELFFFVIQTYLTSFLYLCLSRPTFHPTYLCAVSEPAINAPGKWSLQRSAVVGRLGQLVLIGAIIEGFALVYAGGEGTYLGLILAWACPFMLLLWCLSHDFLLRLPLSNTLLPIALPTIYLWVVDTFALRRGTWSIESGTKLGIHVWDGLEIEEAVFFLATNIMIVFGLVAFDNTMAILYTFEKTYPEVSVRPSPLEAVQALLVPRQTYDVGRIRGLQQAIDRLQKKSRSFFLASAAFQGRLRIDLVLLYSFCRVADDLVDNATSRSEAKSWIDRMRQFIELAYAVEPASTEMVKTFDFVTSNFPEPTHLAFLQLPVARLSKAPLLELLKGFDEDLKFTAGGQDRWPIQTEQDLIQYGEYVAGTVAELCIDLVLYHHAKDTGKAQISAFKAAGRQMGVALQIVNIARDIEVDAHLGRVYIPISWLQQDKVKPTGLIEDPRQTAAASLRTKLLSQAFSLYEGARTAIEDLPQEARRPMRVAIESYMEIGRVLRDQQYVVKRGRATVPKTRRLWVAWKALNS